MKKVFVYAIILFFIIFILPSLFTKSRQDMSLATKEESTEKGTEENVEKNEVEAKEEEKYDYSKYGTIKLLHSETGEIEEINLDEYLYGVVSSEMPADYELEALKAQAVVARTYTIYQSLNNSGKHGEADICDDSSCCQAWISKENRLAKWDEDVRESNWKKIVEAVDSTAGQIITYNGDVIDAFFHSNSGGITETASNVWGGTNYPYLQSVETSGEDEYSQYNSEVELTKDELVNKMKEKYDDFEINFDEENPIEIIEYTESGRVRTIKIGNKEIAGTEARTIFGLKSTNFEVEIIDDKVKFSVIGYGHGVGMSQTGADSMAKTGSNYEDIIMHFYTGVELEYLNDLNT